MKVAVIGCRGMLGNDVIRSLDYNGHEVTPLDLPDIDITEYNNVLEVLPYVDCTINCAAYTLVDAAEENRDLAYRINCEGARNLARVCHLRNMKLIHISTDYVFDGASTRPYEEGDMTNPLSVYGTSKLAGEKAIRAEGGQFVIVRTQALFGIHGKNFVKAIIAKLKQDDQPLRVVEDQQVSPTYTVHLADAILRLINCGKEGIVHVAGGGVATWYMFARAIADHVKPDAQIQAISAADLNLPAKRPANSMFDMKRYRVWTGQDMPGWRQGLDEYMRLESY